MLADNFATVAGGRYTRGTLAVAGAHVCYVREMLSCQKKAGRPREHDEHGLREFIVTQMRHDNEFQSLPTYERNS